MYWAIYSGCKNCKDIQHKHLMNPKLVDQIKQMLKQSLLATSRRVWRTPLDRRTSIKLLDDSIVYKKQHEPINIPALASVNKVPSRFFATEKTVSFDPDYVWKISLNQKINSLTICTSGNTLLNNKLLLDLDFRISGAGILNGLTNLTKLPIPL